MVSITALWLPILLSAVFVFLVSYVLHTVLRYHFHDYSKVPNEDNVMDGFRKMNIPPGEYMMPRPDNPKDMSSPEFREKMKKGTAVIMTLWDSSKASLAKNLTQWFLYCVIVGIFTAYIAGRALGPGAQYLSVFRFAGTTAFLGYAVALWQDSIWFMRSWNTTLKNTFDGLVYALLTAGTFGWLWPD